MKFSTRNTARRSLAQTRFQLTVERKSIRSVSSSITGQTEQERQIMTKEKERKRDKQLGAMIIDRKNFDWCDDMDSPAYLVGPPHLRQSLHPLLKLLFHLWQLGELRELLLGQLQLLLHGCYFFLLQLSVRCKRRGNNKIINFERLAKEVAASVYLTAARLTRTLSSAQEQLIDCLTLYATRAPEG